MNHKAALKAELARQKVKARVTTNEELLPKGSRNEGVVLNILKQHANVACMRHISLGISASRFLPLPILQDWLLAGRACNKDVTSITACSLAGLRNNPLRAVL